MRLYLVRHGQAAGDTPDPKLSSRGCTEVETIADFFLQAELSVDKIIHSGRQRAQQTAEILAHAIASPEAICQKDGLNPNDPPIGIAKICNQCEQDLMLVGHLPFMGRLASLLLLNREDDDFFLMNTATVLCLEKYEGRWLLAWMIGPNL